MNDYNKVISRTAEEFNAKKTPDSELKDPAKFTGSDAEDVSAIERLLDVKPGTLAADAYYLEKVHCQCGRLLTMFDFVFTGLVDAGHSKSFILHTLVGAKYIMNVARGVRCSACARTTQTRAAYEMSSYRCSESEMPE